MEQRAEWLIMQVNAKNLQKKNIFLVNFCVDDFFEGEVLQRASDKAHFQSLTNLAKTFVFHEKKFRFDFSQFN